MPPGFDLVPAFGSRYHGAQRQNHDVQLVVLGPAQYPLIGQVGKTPRQRRLHLLVHALASHIWRVGSLMRGSTAPCHKCLAVNEFSCSGPEPPESRPR